MLFWIIIFSLLGSVVSTAGGVLLLLRKDLAERASIFLITFAAGVLLAVAFLDLLPEAAESFGDFRMASIYALSMVAILFVVERFFWWYHHHRFDTADHPRHAEQHLQPAHAYLLLGGDAIHNFIDGFVIAASFMVSFPLGVVVSVGVIAHELPQEFADFGIMISAGFSRAKTLTLNLLAASTTLIGALIAYFALSWSQQLSPFLLAMGAGVFIYIALSDLIPEIHHQSEHKYDIIHFFLFISAIAFIALLGLTIEHP